MKKHLTLLLVIVVSLAFVGVVLAVDDILILKSPTKGNVKFTHKLHVGYAGGNCQACHHKTPAGGTPAACTSCHTADGQPNGGGVSAKKAFHKQCADCHKKMNKGPKMGNCNGCHGTG